MTETIKNDYIQVTRKNFLLEDSNGKMIENILLGIKGTFLVKIRDNAFKGIDGENVFAHINDFLEIVEPLRIRGLIHDHFRLSVFPISLSGSASEWFRNECIGTNATWESIVEMFTRKFYHLFDHIEEEEVDKYYNPHTFDDVPKIFKIEDDLFSFDTPLFIAFDEFNYLLKIDPDIFTYEIQMVKTYDENEQELNNRTQGPDEPWLENYGPYQPCNHICEPYRFKNGKTKWPTCSSDIDRFCNGGRTTRDGENRSHGLLSRLQVINGHETASFARRHNPYVNVRTEWTHDPYLDTNRIFNRTNGASNVGDTQEDQGHENVMGNPTPEQSVCKIRRFKMMKYSFDCNDEYITIKESEHLNHSNKILDAYHELLRLTNEGWVVTTPEE
ncbi:hypothetical protein Tco_1491941 [Tanacetum coccineum]